MYRFVFFFMMLTSLSLFAKEVWLSESDNGRKVVLQVDDTLVVQLPGNPTTGYMWEVASESKERLGSYESAFEPESTLCGAGGLFTFTFHITAQGETKLCLEYLRPWEKEEPPLKTFNVVLEATAHE